MAMRAKRGGRRIRQVGGAQRASAGGGTELPPELAQFKWLLDPIRTETMRRRFIDGKGGAVERWVTKFAHSRPLVLEHGFVGMRFMTYEQYLLGLGDKPGPKYLNLPPGVVPPAERPHTGASSSGEELTGRLHRAAWALVQDPQYRQALQRRMDDGKAPAMQRLLWDIAEQQARKPEMWRPRRPFCFLSEHPPWLMDPLAERERIMLERRKADDELEARTREEAQTQQPAGPAVTPDEPADPDGLEVYVPES